MSQLLHSLTAFSIVLVVSLICVSCSEGQEAETKKQDSSKKNTEPETFSENVAQEISTITASPAMRPDSEKKLSSEANEVFPSVNRIQNILGRANPDYRGQGKFHQENGAIVAAELPNCGLRDLSPLRGLKLQALDLSGNPVKELRHLKGMPLRNLFLENTRVENLESLKGARLVELRLNNSPVNSLSGVEGQPLENLYAVGTRITEVSQLRSSNLRQLWLSESPVSDVSGLAGLPLISLTLHKTLVEDVLFVRSLPVLQRLHIGETLVDDLTPLAGLNLTRLVFTPSRIKRGMNVVRSLYGLREIGTVFDDTGRDLTSPQAFWAKYSSR
ncbi:MAG: hypothetical protein VX153_01260 [Verrucomicrobiota bacterium]|nr:hypothetical protein [Verrucomicrobiota bacterium]